jgi:hypothetical protein
MALNTNIALGVQPIQQPNMLAQYGQMMALKAAQQETQGNEALRAAYASGGDLSDPEFRRKIMAANPKLGSQLVNQFSEMSARDVKTQSESLKAIKDSIGIVNSPAEMVEFLKGAYSTPGGALLTKLAPFDKAVANIPQDPKSFEEYKRKFSLSADKLFTSAADELRAKVDREGHGVRIRGQNMTAQTAANLLEFNKNKRSVIAGDNQYYTTGAFGDIQPVTGYGTSTPVMPPAAANAFVTQPSVNSLLNRTTAPTAPPVVQPGSPTRANAAAIDAQMNIPRPPPRVGYQYNQQGQQVKIPQVGLPEGMKLRPGERWNEEKAIVEQIPGSALYIEQQKKHSGDLNAVKSVQSTTKWGKDRINKILSDENIEGFNSNFGGYNAYVTQNFSGNAALVKSELDSLKSDLKNKGLQLVRAGGSIGALTEKEWPILESMIATLTPRLNEKDARDVLTSVLQKFEALESLAVEKYGDQWQNTQYFKPVEKTTGGGGGGAEKTVTRTGTINGRKVVQYSDGSTAYAD